MDDHQKLEHGEDVNDANDEQELVSRRDFLVGLKKWSAIVIGGALLGGALAPQEARAGWVNGGRGWVNSRGGWVNGGGSAGWVNRSGGSGGWYNRGTAWANRGTTWVNKSGWYNRSGSWVNRY